MIYLIDVNLFYAFHIPPHTHYQRSQTWFRQHLSEQFATCSISEMGLIRLLMSNVDGIQYEYDEAVMAVEGFRKRPQHLYWSEMPNLDKLIRPVAHRLQGHRQITDAYLLGLAAHHNAKLATLDKALLHLAGPELGAHVEYIQ